MVRISKVAGVNLRFISSGRAMVHWSEGQGGGWGGSIVDPCSQHGKMGQRMVTAPDEQVAPLTVSLPVL